MREEKTRSRKKKPVAEVRSRKKKSKAPAPSPDLPFETENVLVDSLRKHPENYKEHPPEQIEHLAASLRKHGFYKNVVVARDGTLLAGHGVWEATKTLGLKSIPVRRVPIASDSPEAYEILAADNETPLLAIRDDRKLLAVLLKVKENDVSRLLGTGYDEKMLAVLMARAGEGAVPNPLEPRSEGGSLLARFGVPPFSILDARQGYWQERKRAWIELGIRSEEGRGAEKEKGPAAKKGDGVLYKSLAVADPAFYSKKRAKEAELGRELSLDDFVRSHYVPVDAGTTSGSSVFDPVLCELAYRWFSPKGGTVLDPFAGGSVRGIVAACLGRRYVGIDLAERQVEANRKQWKEIAKAKIAKGQPAPSWTVGDSRELPKLAKNVDADLVFSCPPYADLERYSDDPKDLSTLEYPDFRAAYFEIIEKAVARLKNDRFAIFVVGEVRSKNGTYLNFVPDTIAAFEKAGAAFYNEAILVTALASLPMRAARAFEVGRKLGKTHQNVLVFVKGSVKKAVEALGEVEFGDLDAGVEASKPESGVEEIVLPKEA